MLVRIVISVISVMISAGALIGSITSLINIAGRLGFIQNMWDVSETYETVKDQNQYAIVVDRCHPHLLESFVRYLPEMFGMVIVNQM